MPRHEQREALPDHPVPAGLAVPAWRLRVDGLVAQPLALSLSEGDAPGAHTHAADVVCDEGWMVPAQHWEGVALAAILARAGVQSAARVLKGYAGDSMVLLPLEEALAGGALLRLVAAGWAGAPSAGQEAHLLDSTHRVMASSPPPRCGDQYSF